MSREQPIIIAGLVELAPVKHDKGDEHRETRIRIYQQRAEGNSGLGIFKPVWFADLGRFVFERLPPDAILQTGDLVLEESGTWWEVGRDTTTWKAGTVVGKLIVDRYIGDYDE